MLQAMATIRTGGLGHELTPYLPSSRSGSPETLPPLGCHAHQQPGRHQILHQIKTAATPRALTWRAILPIRAVCGWDVAQ
jgi:hypothetical protein